MTKEESSKQALIRAYKVIEHFRSKSKKHPQDGMSTMAGIQFVLKHHYQTDITTLESETLTRGKKQ